jgi:branched-subunit amino acid transport protein
MIIILTFALAGLATFCLRSGMIVFGESLPSSPQVDAGIALVSPTLLAAIVASAVFLDAGQVTLPNLLTSTAIVGAVVAVYRTDNASMALFVGLPIYWAGALVGLS